MSQVVLTLFTGIDDGEPVATALRECLHLPVHLRREAVLGRDFGDAVTSERVTGALARMAVEVALPADRVADALAAARSMPSRR